jgi:hypothetical protein
MGCLLFALWHACDHVRLWIECCCLHIVRCRVDEKRREYLQVSQRVEVDSFCVYRLERILGAARYLRDCCPQYHACLLTLSRQCCIICEHDMTAYVGPMRTSRRASGALIGRDKGCSWCRKHLVSPRQSVALLTGMSMSMSPVLL